MLYPETDLLKRIASEITGSERDIPFFSSPVIFDNRLAYKIYQMHCAFEEPQTPVIERETYLLTVLSELIIRHADSRSLIPSVQQENALVQSIREYLAMNYHRNISLTELSKVTNRSKFYLCRVFREATGLPPHTYLTLIRVRQAKRLLKLGIPIAQVASDVGFFDQTHLTKRFKGVLGITPKQYTKSTARTY